MQPHSVEGAQNSISAEEEREREGEKERTLSLMKIHGCEMQTQKSTLARQLSGHCSPSSRLVGKLHKRGSKWERKVSLGQPCKQSKMP